MNPFTFNAPKSIQFGVGALSRLGELVSGQIGTRVMLVTDPGMIATGIVDRALSSLADAGVAVEVFKDVAADPPEAIVLSAAAQARDAGVKGVVGLGGGPSLDVAKLVALLASGTEDPKDA